MKLKLVYILVGAEKRRGKDTFSKMLIEEIESQGPRYVAYKDAFAFELKQELATIAREQGLDVDMFSEDPELKERVIRPLAKAWGQARKYFDSAYWVRQVIAKAEKESFVRGNDLFDKRAEAQYMFIVISDWRFPEEYHLIEASGAPVFGIFIDRKEPFNHDDETENINGPLCRDLADMVVLNHGNLEQLRALAQRAVLTSILPVFTSKLYV